MNRLKNTTKNGVISWHTTGEDEEPYKDGAIFWHTTGELQEYYKELCNILVH